MSKKKQEVEKTYPREQRIMNMSDSLLDSQIAGAEYKLKAFGEDDQDHKDCIIIKNYLAALYREQELREAVAKGQA